MMEAFEEYGRSVNIRSVTKYSCYTTTRRDARADKEMLLAYERPEAAILTDLVVAIWMYGVADSDGWVLLEHR
jgi:hypothetical protein